MKVRKCQFYITLKVAGDDEKVSVKNSRREMLLEIGRLMASTRKNCSIKINRVRGKRGLNN